MRYLSLCSGIEAATVAWQPLGWHAAGFADIERFTNAVLKHHYPGVPNLGDLSAITDEQVAALGPIDLVIGGTPCQDLSVAGKRAGLTGERSGLFHDFVRIFDAARRLCGARWCLWENVPGAFSAHGGRDFAVVVGSLVGSRFDVPRDGWRTAGAALGPAGVCEWRVLDAQFCGLAQRRKRVPSLSSILETGEVASRFFLSPKACAGILRGAGAGQTVAPTIRAGASNSGAGHGARSGDSRDELIVPVPITFGAQMSAPQTDADLCQALQATNQAAVVQPYVGGLDYENNGHTMDQPTGPLLKGSPTGGGQPLPAIATATQVRRLTPRECERLQGFPDDYTLIPWRKQFAPDGPRYKALGNSMAVPVIRWIGERIDAVSS